VFKKIILCADGSECSKHAAEAAAKLAKQFHSEVVLTNIAPEPPVVSVGPVPIPPELCNEADVRIKNDQYVQKLILDSAKLSLEGAGITPRTMPLAGRPVDEIVDLAEREEADLIILGSRGLGGFRRLLLGSVSDGVLHHAHCPVLIVR
jgi:nucleotide-binding universal stress UspA family protein